MGALGHGQETAGWELTGLSAIPEPDTSEPGDPDLPPAPAIPTTQVRHDDEPSEPDDGSILAW